ncbi:hypothetical protein BG006_006959 [Podila minutissima]|uniref:Uncharacterized protein n=1 Tax=Podila minutissima TaxID=64525 RepID=A0A9P5VL87_9FUNG|nr:hypothetical protein BG006_006959 [Podila minutissima]
MVGPILSSSADKDSLSKQSKIREFKEHAEWTRKKLAGVDEAPTAKASEPSREEWMMVPPESRLLGDNTLKITVCQFLKHEHKPQDSSLRTETPADREKRLRGEPKNDDEDSSLLSKRSRRHGSDNDKPTY